MDLNSNLDAAAARLANQVDQLLVMHADLPAATIQEVSDLLAAHQGGVTLVAATVDAGTNAMIVAPPDALPFRFGPQSLMRHRAAASQAGLACRIFESPGLGRDMDRPDDLAWLLQQSRDSRAGTFLAALGIGRRLNAPLRDSA
jgi:2-phospho-L-lactate guanylyltransferase